MSISHFSRPRRHGARLTLACAAWLSLATTAGCGGPPEPGTPEAAAYHLGEVLNAGEPAAVLPLTTEETQRRLSALHAQLATQREAIQTEYPEDQRGGTKLTYPEGALQAKTPEALFAILIGPWMKGLAKGEGLLYGLGARSVRMESDTVALVSTRAGELLRFEKAGDDWKLAALEVPLQANLDRAKKNQVALENNLLVFNALKAREAKKKPSSPKPDEGAPSGEGATPPGGEGQPPSP